MQKGNLESFCGTAVRQRGKATGHDYARATVRTRRLVRTHTLVGVGAAVSNNSGYPIFGVNLKDLRSQFVDQHFP